ncbi:hypothetical protein D9757_011827 [Collybiopsis confluens]|uniref:Fungal-type protein kinase domain-containing protein n=1 Tax=Collybiopsis confluens TaxID=2823264 RepID=A0A8H5LYU5_9AGAR|nr:hypothetical protein D9757_011827 [Collybiopsis confluens]
MPSFTEWPCGKDSKIIKGTVAALGTLASLEFTFISHHIYVDYVERFNNPTSLDIIVFRIWTVRDAQLACDRTGETGATTYVEDMANIMYRREGDDVYGVLNDFELSSFRNFVNDGPTSKHRTGTKPFMAFDLLDAGSDRNPHALRSLKILNYLDKDGWVELRQAKREKKGENPTYEFLGPLAKLVTMAAVTADATLKPQAEARPSPTATSRHSKPGYRFFPDWTSVLVSSSLDVDPKPHRGTTRKDSVDTSDISAIGEFKLGQTKEDICDDEEKLVGAANQLLWNDPCRERVLGFTIEDKRTRFWDFSRCSVTVSEDFDLDKKPEFLVEFLLFITFAEKHEMGFDPTMHRVLVENQTRFVYEVGGKSYITVGQPLSEEAAYRLVGRATVRTTIVEVGGKAFGIGSKKRVLKDVWLYEDALLEKDIQEEILARLNDSDRKTLENHFLTFDKEEVVTFEGKERYTLKSGNAKSADWHNDSYSHRNSGISASRGTRENPKRQEPEHARVTHAHTRRKHVRSVAKEMCLSLYELTNFGDALICWHDTVKCLNLFRKAGFLHRDLSGGNTLFFERRGIISDLEYCKKYRNTSIHDLKTGTPDFMAAEYQANRFFFLPEPAKETKNLFKHKRDWFAVHFVHDLESIYWQYLWFLHNRIPDRRVSRESLDQISDRAKLYFGHNINGNDDRSRIIQEPGSNLELQQYLSPVHSTSYLKLLSLSGKPATGVWAASAIATRED